MKLTEYLETMEKKLRGSYDIERDYVIGDIKYEMFAKYKIRSERYILTKKATIYAIESNEYCLIKFFNDINLRELRTYIDTLTLLIDKLVTPGEDHMSSIITGVIVLNNRPNSEIIDTIKRFKYQKGFLFGLRGWVDIRLIVVSLNEEFVVTNKKGKEVSEVYITKVNK